MSEQEPLSYFQSKGWLNILKYVENLSIIVLAVSGVFMTFHWPFNTELFIIGLSGVAYYCVFRNLGQKPIVQVLSICWGIFFMGILFKIMHWPWANILVLIGGLGAIIQSLLSMLAPAEVKESTGGFFNSKTFKNVMKSTAGLSKVVSILGIIFLIFRWSGASEVLIVGFSSLALTYLLGSLGSSTLGQKLNGLGWCFALMGLLFDWFKWPNANVILLIGCVLLILSSLLAVLTPIEK